MNGTDWTPCGSRVVVLSGEWRGLIGYVRGGRWKKHPRRRKPERLYLVGCNPDGRNVGWWTEVSDHDMTVVDPPKEERR